MNDQTVAKRGESPSVRPQITEGLVEQIAERLVEKMECPGEVARDLATLALYDVAILISDSGTMMYKEDGVRKEALILFIDLIAEIYSITNEAGTLNLRFMNYEGGESNWTGSSRSYLSDHKYGGGRRIGTELKEKILDKFVIGNSNRTKPLLVLIVTDGTAIGEKRGHLKNVIQDCVNECKGSGKKADAVTFQFTRIGKDSQAAQLLKDLDADPDIREYIDVLPGEFSRKRLKEDKWFVLPKILLGAILSDWRQQK